MSDLSAELDRVFEDLVDHSEAAATPEAGPPPPRPIGPDPLEDALHLFYHGQYARCMARLKDVDPSRRSEPRARALEAVGAALGSGRIRPGIQACLNLLEQGDPQPDLYCILGVLLLKTHQRTQAYEVFQSGLALDPHHRGLQECLHRMGTRREPVLRFLPRSHLANRLLGLVRARLDPSSRQELCP